MGQYEMRSFMVMNELRVDEVLTRAEEEFLRQREHAGMTPEEIAEVQMEAETQAEGQA